MFSDELILCDNDKESDVEKCNDNRSLIVIRRWRKKRKFIDTTIYSYDNKILRTVDPR